MNAINDTTRIIAFLLLVGGGWWIIVSFWPVIKNLIVIAAWAYLVYAVWVILNGHIPH